MYYIKFKDDLDLDITETKHIYYRNFFFSFAIRKHFRIVENSRFISNSDDSSRVKLSKEDIVNDPQIVINLFNYYFISARLNQLSDK